jgi:hypothetical protein
MPGLALVIPSRYGKVLLNILTIIPIRITSPLQGPLSDSGGWNALFNAESR